MAKRNNDDWNRWSSDDTLATVWKSCLPKFLRVKMLLVHYRPGFVITSRWNWFQGKLGFSSSNVADVDAPFLPLEIRNFQMELTDFICSPIPSERYVLGILNVSKSSKWKLFTRFNWRRSRVGIVLTILIKLLGPQSPNFITVFILACHLFLNCGPFTKPSGYINYYTSVIGVSSLLLRPKFALIT